MLLTVLALHLLAASAEQPGAAPAPAPPAASATVPSPVPATGASVVAGAPDATRGPAAPSSTLIEKLGAGDRAFLAGDHRTALFAYQDAVYLDPTSAVARIRLARAYAALGHQDQAERQLVQALELDPGNTDIVRLVEELRRPSAARPAAGPAGPTIVPVPGAGATAAPKVYRLTEDVAGLPLPAAPAAVAPESAPGHYKAALGLIAARDFSGAIVELDRALQLDPRLGVALAARASAYFGLARYQDAARDYLAALERSPQLATPLYGLAESYRQLKDPRAGGYFTRYAESTAADVQPDLRVSARQWAEQLGVP